jgi:hypothetical protein
MRPYFQMRQRGPDGRPLPPAAATPATGAAAPPAQTGAAQPGATASGPPAIGTGELATRREGLAREMAKLHWDLGGLTYEMAIRDHFRLDLLVRQAARLQQVDAELGAIDRMMRLEQAGAAGECSVCGALFPRGAVYCGQCGNDLVGRVTLATPPPAPPPAAPAAPPAQTAPPPATPSTDPPPTEPPAPEALHSASIGGPPA